MAPLAMVGLHTPIFTESKHFLVEVTSIIGGGYILAIMMEETTSCAHQPCINMTSSTVATGLPQPLGRFTSTSRSGNRTSAFRDVHIHFSW